MIIRTITVAHEEFHLRRLDDGHLYIEDVTSGDAQSYDTEAEAIADFTAIETGEKRPSQVFGWFKTEVYQTFLDR